MEWSKFIQQIVIYFLGTGGIAWFFKSVIIHSIDKRSKLYELELNNKSELFKSELNLLNEKANKLHDRRLEKIESIYSLLEDFSKDLFEITALLMHPQNPNGEDLEKREVIKRSVNSGNAFYLYYYKHKIFFSKNICSTIDEIIKHLKTTLDILQIDHINLYAEKERHEKLTEAFNNIRYHVPSIKEKLENEFRQLIGVENES